jgi:lysozyme
MPAVALIAEAEGFSRKAYRCPAGVWTCGFGETAGVTPATVWTDAECDQRLCESLTTRAVQIRALLSEHANDNQLGAMVSLAYNIGMGAFAKSTVLKAHNRGDFSAAARAFSLWNKATVAGALVVLAGLTARRAAEAALYLKPDPDAPAMPMVQAVQAESPLAASPIAQSGAVTAGAGALGLLSQAGDQVGAVGATVQQAKTIATDTLGLPADWFLPALLVAVGGIVLVQRYRQRAGGWA